MSKVKKNRLFFFLNVQVLIGQNQKQKKVVGYFNCTHLHAPEGKSYFKRFVFFLRKNRR